jgi:tetratricopeptide (TPR) repeat protein
MNVLILVLSLNLAYSQRVYVKISIPKTSFLENESIFLMFEVKNITNTNIEIQRPFVQSGAIEIHIKDRKGKIYHNKGFVDDFSSKVTLMPGATQLGSLNLTSYYGKIQEYKMLTYFLEGKYTVKVIYYADYKHSEKYESQELTFNVEKPQGNEVFASEEYKKGYYEYLKSNYKESVEIFEELCKQYPNSLYIPDAYDQLQYIYARFLKDTTRSTNYAELLLNYPNNGNARGIIHFLSMQYSKTDKMYKLDSIKNKHKNTLLEKIIDEYKNEVKLRELREQSGIK